MHMVSKCLWCRLADEGRSIGFPLLVKAVLGGGGKGMKLARAPDDLEVSARSRGLLLFCTIYLGKTTWQHFSCVLWWSGSCWKLGHCPCRIAA